MNFPWRKRPTATYQKTSQELPIGDDGQVFVSATAILASNTILESKIDAHITKLQSLYNQYASTASNADTEKAAKLVKLKHSVESAESDKAHGTYARGFINIAEAYECYGAIDPNAHENGWQLAWNVLNHEALEAVLAISRGQKDAFENSYADLLFIRGMHCLREMVSFSDAKAQNGSAEETIRKFYLYLWTTHRLNVTHWQANDALKYIHVAIAYGGVDTKQLQEIEAKIVASYHDELITQLLNEVHSYEFTVTDRDRLKRMVY